MNYQPCAFHFKCFFKYSQILGSKSHYSLRKFFKIHIKIFYFRIFCL